VQRNDLDAAALNLGAAAKLAPNNVRVWVALGQTYWKEKEREKEGQAAARAPGPGEAACVQDAPVPRYFVERSPGPQPGEH